MKKFIKIVVISLISYLIYAFVYADLNPLTWNTSSRFLLIFSVYVIYQFKAIHDFDFDVKMVATKEDGEKWTLSPPEVTHNKPAVTKEQYDKAWSDLQGAELGYNESHADFTARKAGYQKIISDYRQP